MSRYTYSLVRFVPNPATGEFVNVGAVAGSDELLDWSARVVSNQSRARALDDRKVLAKVFERVDELDVLCAGDPDDDRNGSPVMNKEKLAKLCQQWQHVVQLSEPMPIVAESAAEALDIVFAHMITDPGVQKRVYRDKRAAYSVLLQAYKSLGTEWDKDHLLTRKIVKPIHHPVKFDFVVSNAKVVQLTQAWSFEVLDSENVTNDILAWAWAVGEIRKTGASLFENSTIDVPRDVDVEAVYLPPKHEAGQRAFEQAEAAFREVNVRAVPANDVNEVADRAAKLLSIAAE